MCWLRDKNKIKYFHYLIHFCQVYCDSIVHKYQSRQLPHISVYQSQDKELHEDLDILLLKIPKSHVGLLFIFNFSPVLTQVFLPHVKNLCSVADNGMLVYSY